MGNIKHVLTIAGSDTCAGAGLQADIKTISALGAYALTVVTSLTAQNTRGVRAVLEQPPEFIQSQLDAILEDIRIDAIKIGMLGGSSAIKTVARCLAPLKVPVVLDPVMTAKSGDRLLDASAIGVLKDELLPLATVITPNIPETEELTGSRIEGLETMTAACQRLLGGGIPWVVIKGGHLSGDPVDVVGNGERISLLTRRRVGGNNNHGTGCTYSSAIAAGIAQGLAVPEAIDRARDYIQDALVNGFSIGKGVGVLDHFPRRLYQP